MNGLGAMNNPEQNLSMSVSHRRSMEAKLTPGLRSVTNDVAMIDSLKLSGNMIPHAWYKHLKTPAGTTDAVACLVLAEIVFWYRSTEVERGGQMVVRQRKFDGDILQKSYDDLADTLGFTHDQVQAAIVRLEKRSILKREFRTIKFRGTKVSHVLYIRLFPSAIRDISVIPPDGVSLESQETYAENLAYPPLSSDRGAILESDTFPPGSADKYIEHHTEHSIQHTPSFPGSTTSSSMKPGKPAPNEFSESSTEKPEPRSLAREVAAVPFSSSAKGSPVAVPGLTETPASDEDFTEIDRILCHAFGGTPFTRHGETKLKEFIAAGRITRLWAKGFARVKSAFDQDRDGFKAKKLFVPVQPVYLFSNFDLTENAMLDTLGDRRSTMEEMTRGFDVDDHAKAAKVIAEYDAYFRRNKCLESSYEAWVKSYPGRHDTVFDVLCDPKQFPSWHPDDVVVPAWMRLLYANQINIYSFGAIRKVLLEAAQAELRRDPRCLKFVGVDLSDEQIREVFDLDYKAELAVWQKEFDRLDDQLAAVEDILAEIVNCQATGLLT